MVVGISAEGWNTEADVSLNLNQNEYSDNWAGAELGFDFLGFQVLPAGRKATCCQSE